MPKMKTLAPGFYWVSEAEKPTKQSDWYVAHHTGGNCWYVTSNECTFSQNSFRHVDPTPIKRESVDRRVIPANKVKSFLDFVLTEIVGIPHLEADKYKSVYAEWKARK